MCVCVWGGLNVGDNSLVDINTNQQYNVLMVERGN